MVNNISGSAGKLHSAKDALNPRRPELGIANSYIAPGFLTPEWGTISGLVMDTHLNLKVILSTAHVLRGDNSLNNIDSTSDIINWDEQVIGVLTLQQTSQEVDAALVVPSDDAFAANIMPITEPREITPAEAKARLPVMMSGLISGDRTGVVVADSEPFTFSYFGVLTEIADLVKVGTKQANGRFAAISQKGDSGALVTDNNGMPIGILIGGTSQFSYVMKLTNIFNKLTNIKYF